jgi:hypothetical protein
MELRARVRGHSLLEERTRVDDARARLPVLLEEVKHFCVGRHDAESLVSEVSRKRRPLSALKSATKRRSRTRGGARGGDARGGVPGVGHEPLASICSCQGQDPRAPLSSDLEEGESLLNIRESVLSL